MPVGIYEEIIEEGPTDKEGNTSCALFSRTSQWLKIHRE